MHTLAKSLLLPLAALAFAAGAQAASHDAKHDAGHSAAVVCQDGSHAANTNGCSGHGGVKAGSAKADAGTAVQTESSKVNATGQAPTTGLPTKTPAKPDPAAK